MDMLIYNQALDEEEKHFCSILLNYAILQNEDQHYITIHDLLSLIPGYSESSLPQELSHVTFTTL